MTKLPHGSRRTNARRLPAGDVEACPRHHEEAGLQTLKSLTSRFGRRLACLLASTLLGHVSLPDIYMYAAVRIVDTNKLPLVWSSSESRPLPQQPTRYLIASFDRGGALPSTTTMASPLASIRAFAASLAPTTRPSTASPQAPSKGARSACSLQREMWARLKNGGLAVVITCVAQLLITLIQRLLDETHVDFPSSIVAMAIVFGVFSIAGQLFPSVDAFYQKHLRSPVSPVASLRFAVCGI